MEEPTSADALMPINVWVAGRSYRIRIPAADEAFVRHAVKRANGQITELRQHYAGKDDQDFIAMCLLMYATERTRSTAIAADDEIEAMIRKIDRAIGA